MSGNLGPVAEQSGDWTLANSHSRNMASPANFIVPLARLSATSHWPSTDLYPWDPFPVWIKTTFQDVTSRTQKFKPTVQVNNASQHFTSALQLINPSHHFKSTIRVKAVGQHFKSKFPDITSKPLSDHTKQSGSAQLQGKRWADEAIRLCPTTRKTLG